jgi:hypothetical protein
MKQPANNLLITILIFTIAFLSAALAQFYPDAKIFIRITLLFSFVYLFLGWHIFKYYYPNGIFPIWFLMGYFYSSILITAVFSAAEWPLSTIIITISPVWALAQSGVVLMIRKKLSVECFIQLLIETGFLLILSVLMILTL